jgi:sterol desaturase/sphingolipid hydroxylase (fatty acid hydroxylase superfamily)
VYPPILAGLFVVIGYFTIYPLLGGMQYEARLIGLLGFGVGYLMYDMVHYALHHIETRSNNYFKKLQRYHNMHHYSGQEAAYGVTSKLWDMVFGTQLIEPSKIA